MKYLLPLVLLCCVGCDLDTQIVIDFGGGLQQVARPKIDYPAFQREYPTINLLEELRQKNWPGSEGGGSCVHATMIMLFRHQGRDDLAELWKSRYENGEYPDRLAEKMDREGVRFAYTSQQKDVGFLEWAIRTRRGCGVTVMGGAHMVMLVHLDATQAGILDNNRPGEIKWVPRETFLNEWRNSRSWAVTPVYTPPSPPPSS